MIDRRPLGHSRNTREGRCSDCSRRRTVFEIDGTDAAICPDCIRGQVEVVAEMLETKELYEGSSILDWLEAHRAHRRGVIGCPFCSAGRVR